MKWPNDADGDVFRRLAKEGFDFDEACTVGFDVEFESWPPSAEALSLLREFHPDARVHEPEDGYPGFVEFRHTGKLSYELVTSTQQAMSQLMKLFGGVCESWGVLQIRKLEPMTTLYDFKAKSLDGREIDLAQFKGKTVLVVNTASKCGFTPQYEGLEKLYEQYKDKDLVILGFPCNQFGSQEPGGADEIGAFCTKNYGVSFPMFEKIDVNGADTHPLYEFLKSEAPGFLGTKNIKWNFTKFLVNKDGDVVERFGSTTKPADLEAPIKKIL